MACCAGKAAFTQAQVSELHSTIFSCKSAPFYPQCPLNQLSPGGQAGAHLSHTGLRTTEIFPAAQYPTPLVDFTAFLAPTRVLILHF